ncbi:MAG: 4-diphosphocytidyl-2-C-methyl-D-erythritol kinase [Gaiellaceae bacterium]|nr:MAG: 4-diphosphocytidyl-2-C-methyl-D-erythritol kinase [Gaiellaceae bacterium]
MNAPAKLNLSLVVGPLRPDGKHEVETVLQALELADRIELEPAPALSVEGFPEDTLVRDALAALRAAAGSEHWWRVRIEKRIPVAAGLGGGSSDAATALRLANATLAEPVGDERLHALAARVGADVPYFLVGGSQLATGDGTVLEPVSLPTDYAVLLVLPHGVRKSSTASVYAALDARDGARGFESRRAALRAALERVSSPRDLATLPPNDLCSSPLAASLVALGAFRADVTGAGPTVYGLFERASDARRAADVLRAAGQVWLTRPARLP